MTLLQAQIESLFNRIHAECMEIVKGNATAQARLDSTRNLAWNKRIHRAIGRCVCWPGSNRRQVELSTRWAEHLPVERWDDVIRHELAHAVCDSDEWHGPNWKRWARKLGANPKRCAAGSEVRVAGMKVREDRAAKRAARRPKRPAYIGRAWERWQAGRYYLRGTNGDVSIVRRAAGVWELDYKRVYKRFATLAEAQEFPPEEDLRFANRYHPNY